MDYTIVQDAFGIFRLPTSLEKKHGLKTAFGLVAGRRRSAWESGRQMLPFAASRADFSKLRLVVDGREVKPWLEAA